MCVRCSVNQCVGAGWPCGGLHDTVVVVCRFDFRTQEYVGGIMEEEVAPKQVLALQPVGATRHFVLYLYDREKRQASVCAGVWMRGVLCVLCAVCFVCLVCEEGEGWVGVYMLCVGWT
jgi:hypothetical protein